MVMMVLGVGLEALKVPIMVLVEVLNKTLGIKFKVLEHCLLLVLKGSVMRLLRRALRG